MQEIDKGALTVNEYRKMKGREPVEWGDEPKQPVSFGDNNPLDNNPDSQTTNNNVNDKEKDKEKMNNDLNIIDNYFTRSFERYVSEA